MGRHRRRSLRSVSKEDVSSLLTDSGVSLLSTASPPLLSQHQYHDDNDNDNDHDDNAAADAADYSNVLKHQRPKRSCTSKYKQRKEHTASDDSTVSSIVSSALGKQSKQFATDYDDDDDDDDTDATDDDNDNDKSDAQQERKIWQKATTAKRPRKTYICSMCRKQFGGSTDLKRHMLVHNDERPFKCSKCGKRYRQAVNLKNHITTMHEGLKNFQCSQCPKAFALKQRLRLHMRLHSGEKPYACKTCGKRFARGGQLQQHFVMHHKDCAKIYHCQKCSSSFSTPANLRAHESRHDESPDLVCDVCKSQFFSEIMLRTHMKEQHYRLQPFQCDVCNQIIEDEDLPTHMKTHKTHVCEVCNSYFTQKSQYNVHIRMHTGERPYQCRICNQAFAHSSVLKLHIRKHTGEKPFHCLLCKSDVSFSQLAHLKTHMKKIHKQEKPYMCEGCQKFFKVKMELLAHVEKCAKGKEQTAEIEQVAAMAKEQQTLSHMRFLLAMLLKKISTAKKLQQLGYEKRLIDNVVIASLKLANRKACEDEQMSAIERLRLNVQELLNWIVPANMMEKFKELKLSTDDILIKMVTKHTQEQ